jgi:hypothetical protein
MAGSATPGEPAQSYSSSTLNSIRADPRKDHDRVVDAIIQYNVENYEDSSIDIILKEVPYYHTGSTSPDEPEARHGKSKGEIDVGLVNLDEGIIRYLEIKTHPGDREYGEDQVDRCAESFTNAREQSEGFDWEMIGDVVLSSNISEEYALPVQFTGTYYGEDDAIEQAENSDGFETLADEFFDGRLRLDDEDVLEPTSPATMEDLM